MKSYLKYLMLAAALSCAGIANAIPLSTLSSGGTLTVGDKTFSNFSYFSADAGLLAQAASLDVTAYAIGDVYYLNYAGNLFVASSGAAVLGDVLLNYKVTANNGLISMIDQSYTPNGTPTTGQVTIGETVKDSSGVTILGNSTLTLNPTDLSDPLPEVGDNLSINPPQSALLVTKDIGFYLAAGNGVNLVGLSQVTQSFHQVSVPDGGTTAVLLGLGLLGVGFMARRFKSVKA